MNQLLENILLSCCYVSLLRLLAGNFNNLYESIFGNILLNFNDDYMDIVFLHQVGPASFFLIHVHLLLNIHLFSKIHADFH